MIVPSIIRFEYSPAANCSGVQNSTDASQQNLPFNERNNILTCEVAVTKSAVTPPPGTSKVGNSISDKMRLFVVTNILKKLKLKLSRQATTCEKNQELVPTCKLGNEKISMLSWSLVKFGLSSCSVTKEDNLAAPGMIGNWPKLLSKCADTCRKISPLSTPIQWIVWTTYWISNIYHFSCQL